MISYFFDSKFSIFNRFFESKISTSVFCSIIFSQHKGFFPKWDASSGWSSSLDFPVQNSGQVTIGKTQPTLLDTWFWPVTNNTPMTLLIIESDRTFEPNTNWLIVLRQGFKLRIIIRIAGWLSGDLCDIITTFVMYIHVFNCAINSSFCDTFELKLTKNLLEGL